MQSELDYFKKLTAEFEVELEAAKDYYERTGRLFKHLSPTQKRKVVENWKEDHEKLYPEGWILFCPDCNQYVSQSDPQDDSRRKTVIIDDESCEKCKAKEVQEAQQICGRLGIAEPKP